jgi:hypothetical protein
MKDWGYLPEPTELEIMGMDGAGQNDSLPVCFTCHGTGTHPMGHECNCDGGLRPEPPYSDRVRCQSCANGSGPNGCTDCLNTGRDFQAFVGGIEGALNDAYAEGRKDERAQILEELRAARAMLDAALAKAAP